MRNAISLRGRRHSKISAFTCTQLKIQVNKYTVHGNNLAPVCTCEIAHITGTAGALGSYVHSVLHLHPLVSVELAVSIISSWDVDQEEQSSDLSELLETRISMKAVNMRDLKYRYSRGHTLCSDQAGLSMVCRELVSREQNEQPKPFRLQEDLRYDVSISLTTCCPLAHTYTAASPRHFPAQPFFWI